MQTITFQQIEYFLKVAEHQSITKAANELFVSQPAVSRSIQAFEERIGFPLFIRNAQGIFLTEEGKYIYLALRPLYDSFFRIISNASKIAGLAPKHVHVAIGSDVFFSGGYRLVRQILDDFREANPEYNVTESVLEDSNIINNIRINDVHVTFCSEVAAARLEGAEIHPIADLHPYIAMSSHNPLANRDVVTPELLNGLKFYYVANMDATAPRSECYTMCQKLGFMPGKVSYPPNFLSLTQAIQLNKGLGLLFDVAQPPEREGLLARPLEYEGPTPRLVAAWITKDEPQTVRHFKEFIKSECQKLYQ